MTRAETLLAYVAEHHPRSVRGIEEARAVDPAAWDAVAEQFLG